MYYILDFQGFTCFTSYVYHVCLHASTILLSHCLSYI